MVLRHSNLVDRPAIAARKCSASVYAKAERQDVADWVNRVLEPNALHPSNWIIFDHSADKIEHLMHYWPSVCGAPGSSLLTYIFLQ